MTSLEFKFMGTFEWHRRTTLAANSGSVVIGAPDETAFQYQTPGGSNYELMINSGSLGITGTDALFQIVRPSAGGSLSVTGTAASFNVTMPAASGSVAITGTGANLLQPQVSFTMNIPATGYVVSFTDTSTIGPDAITGWFWQIDGPGGTVHTSTDQHPTFDMSAEGQDNYDVFLTISVGLFDSDSATDSFTLNAPTTDDVALGYPSAVSTGTTGERISIPIVRARDPANVELVSPAQVELRITADGVPISGPKIRTWGLDLGDLTDIGDYLFSGTLEEGGVLSFDKQPGHSVYEVRLVTQGANTASHSRDINAPLHFILRTNGGGTSVGLGAWDINANVPGIYSYTDVANYKYHGQQWIQRARISDADELSIDAIDALQVQVPTIGALSIIRWDLAWYGETTQRRPAEAWGTQQAFPPEAEGKVPRSGATWAQAVADLAAGTTPAQIAAGDATPIIQDPANAALTANLTLPQAISIIPDGGGAGVHYWRVRENMMKANDDAWLNRVADAYVIWRANNGNVATIPGKPRLAGYIIGPSKIQFADPFVDTGQLLQGWLYDNDNPNWNPATNSGGSVQNAWTNNDGPYSDSTDTVLDVLEGSWKLTRLLAEKDPTAVIMYDPLPAHVAFGATTRGHYETQWVAANGGTAADAKAYYVQRQKEMAKLSYYLFPLEVADNPSGANVSSTGMDYIDVADRNELRELTRAYNWVRYMENPQSTL